MANIGDTNIPCPFKEGTCERINTALHHSAILRDWLARAARVPIPCDAQQADCQRSMEMLEGIKREFYPLEP